MKNFILYIIIGIVMKGTLAFGLSDGYKQRLDKYFPSGTVRDFAYAASTGDEKKVKDILASGYNINQSGEKGMTPLIFSAMLGNRKAIILLLENGANSNQQSDEGSSAMSYVAKNGDMPTLEAVLKHGGDVNLRNKKTLSTPLFDAISSDDPIPKIKFLLAHGSKIDSQNGSGESVMMRAAGNGRYDIVLFLLDAGANPKIEDNWHKTILYTIQNFDQWEGFPYEADRKKVAERLKKSGFWRLEKRKM
jgi:ankyrin repeat protein